jgi:D-sedoheptulose 7-phosphate isomerase
VNSHAFDTSEIKTYTLSHLDAALARHAALRDLREPILQAANAICRAHRAGRQVFVCGNGGSASDAEHIVGELVKQFKLPRLVSDEDAARLREVAGKNHGEHLASKLQRGVRAVSLVSQTSLTTAVANDTDATFIFAQQVYVYGQAGDVVWGISTSGNSRNVVNALQVGKAFGLLTIGLIGAHHGAMDGCCDILIQAPATETYAIQELHLPIYHAICMMVEEELFGEEIIGEES